MALKGYPVFNRWYKLLDWLLDKCDKMPKHTRFTISGRVANICLDITELLIETVYSKEKKARLQLVNLYLEKLRVFFRLAQDRRYWSLSQYTYACQELGVLGKMLGGWLKQCPA